MLSPLSPRPEEDFCRPLAPPDRANFRLAKSPRGRRMRRLIGSALSIAIAITSVQGSATGTDPLTEVAQAVVLTQTMSARCEKSLPGLKPQLQDARTTWTSMLSADQLQAGEAYEQSKDGKRFAKALANGLSRGFNESVIAAAETCIGLLKFYRVSYPTPVGTSMPADKVKWHLDNFAPLVLSALKCARLDGIDVAAAPDGTEVWSYRGCGRTETLNVAPPSDQRWPMDDAIADRLFATMVR